MFDHVIIEDDDYLVRLEYQGGEVFLHCDVHNFDEEIYERMVNDWLDMEEALAEEGFTRVIAIPEKEGFVEKTGWERVNTIEYNNKEYGVYVWDLLSR